METSPLHLAFDDGELIQAFSNVQWDVGLGPASGSPELEVWPFWQSEGDRLDVMCEGSRLSPINLTVIQTAEALMRHELRWFSWVSVCDLHYAHRELTALRAAGFTVNRVWRPSVPGPNASDRQRNAWLGASVTKRYVWRYLMAACMVWRPVRDMGPHHARSVGCTAGLLRHLADHGVLLRRYARVS